MIIAGLIAIYLIYKNKHIDILKEPVIIFIALFALLNLLMALFSDNSVVSRASGLEFNLRYYIFFVLVYIALKMFPSHKMLFIKIGIISAAIVCIFGLLQIFVLPKDILRHIGYSSETIYPYMTVDKNESYIRINSTLRGPNPLGAYVVVVISMIFAMMIKIRPKLNQKRLVLLSLLTFSSIVTLLGSYSRSAWIAAAISLLVVLFITQSWRAFIKIFIASLSICLIVVVSMFSLVKSDFISNIFLHDNPSSSSKTDSNEQHSKSLSQGLSLMVSQPLGAGIGSTGSASIMDGNGLIIENQYLFVAHELGWLGLVLFVFINAILLKELWKRRNGWFATGVIASGVGLMLIGLVLPIWVDDTVSIIWWGGAAVAMCCCSFGGGKQALSVK